MPRPIVSIPRTEPVDAHVLGVPAGVTRATWSPKLSPQEAQRRHEAATGERARQATRNDAALKTLIAENKRVGALGPRQAARPALRGPSTAGSHAPARPVTSRTPTLRPPPAPRGLDVGAVYARRAEQVRAADRTDAAEPHTPATSRPRSMSAIAAAYYGAPAGDQAAMIGASARGGAR